MTVTKDQIDHIQEAKALGIIFLCLNLLIFVPFLSISTYKYYKQKNHNLAIIKRRPNIVIICAVITVFYIIIYKTVDILLRLNVFRQGNDDHRRTTYFWLWASHPFSIFPLHLSLFRFWLLFYDVIWYRLSINNQWQSILNPTLNENNWFWTHKHTYGNTHWLRWRCLAISLSLLTIEAVMELIRYYHPLPTKIYAESFFYFILIPPHIYIWRKLPKEDDHLYIRKEVKFTTFFIILDEVFIILFQIIFNFVPEQHQNNVILGLIINETYTIFHVLYICVQLNYVLYIFQTKRGSVHSKKQSLYHYDVPELVNQLSASSKSVNYEMMIERSEQEQIYSLDMILCHFKAFEFLVNFMCKEHCYEYLLFLTEINQFKQRMIKQYFVQIAETDKISLDDMKNSLIQISKDIPQSVLVFDEALNENEPLRVFRTIIHALYEKYIKKDNDLAIKTSFILRKRFDFWMEDKEKWLNGDVVLSLRMSTMSPFGGSIRGGSMSVKKNDADAFKMFYIFEQHLKICKSFCMTSFERFRESEEYEQVRGLIMFEENSD